MVGWYIEWEDDKFDISIMALKVSAKNLIQIFLSSSSSCCWEYSGSKKCLACTLRLYLFRGQKALWRKLSPLRLQPTEHARKAWKVRGRINNSLCSYHQWKQNFLSSPRACYWNDTAWISWCVAVSFVATATMTINKDYTYFAVGVFCGHGCFSMCYFSMYRKK